MSFKETKFVKQNWLRWVKWWPNVLERDQIYETEVFAKDEMDGQVPRFPDGTGAEWGGGGSTVPC